MKKESKYPKGFMKIMKDKKKNKIRKISIENDISEKYFNDAKMVL